MHPFLAWDTAGGVRPMNEHLRQAKPRTPTQAAEGFPRWRWTLAEFDRFAELGFFGADDRVELIGGEIVPMSPKGIAHEQLRARLGQFLSRRVPEAVLVLHEAGWRPDGEQYLEPDILIVPDTSRLIETPGPDALQLIEVAHTSLAFDLDVKAQIYSALGVREYWVVSADTGVTHVHRGPGPQGYCEVTVVDPDVVLTPTLIAGVSLRTGDLG